MSARNIIAMHHAMAQREDMQQIKADALNPTYQHPRDAKLAKLKGLMGADAYATWYAENQNANMRVAAWEAIIDAAIDAALTPPADDDPTSMGWLQTPAVDPDADPAHLARYGH